MPEVRKVLLQCPTITSTEYGQVNGIVDRVTARGDPQAVADYIKTDHDRHRGSPSTTLASSTTSPSTTSPSTSSGGRTLAQSDHSGSTDYERPERPAGKQRAGSGWVTAPSGRHGLLRGSWA